ncbi:hypothetical protein ZIOFF_050682 [Zingiber officinale]|uniref:BHLH domain-containing protein n=1 Tax=Zingiber officinale TaxID=94328 RepID=A0A8J5FLJ1_ZINOF|nr:hypothetical protein ZIOFF_050682 [Zingiber officinale]
MTQKAARKETEGTSCGERKEYWHGRVQTSKSGADSDKELKRKMINYIRKVELCMSFEKDRQGSEFTRGMGESYTDEEKYGLATTLDRRKMDNCWEQQMVNPARFALTGIQQEFYGKVLPASFSSTLSKNMFEFSNKNNMYIQLANSSSECNSIRTGIAPKKARFQGSFSTQSTFKVRKEKIGDRITALHQLVSPFGKTDTASVLLEVSGYIRFLQSQIEALSLPYLSSAPGNMKHPQTGRNNNEGEKKDLKSRGLCLVPVSFILQV